jgi:hypothetical protein
LDDDDLIAWQDVLDEIAAGRGEGLSCPFCRTGKLEIGANPDGARDSKTRIECNRCKKFIEGQFAG